MPVEVVDWRENTQADAPSMIGLLIGSELSIVGDRQGGPRGAVQVAFRAASLIYRKSGGNNGSTSIDEPTGVAKLAGHLVEASSFWPRYRPKPYDEDDPPAPLPTAGTDTPAPVEVGARDTVS